jgi:hypothetical protein
MLVKKLHLGGCVSLNNPWTTIATCGCLCFALASGACAADGTPPVGNNWRAWVELGAHTADNHVDAQHGEGTFWVPLLQGRTSLLFTNVHGKVFEEDQREGNAAVGYREMLQNGWNLGVWTGFDRRHTVAGTIFGQMSLGMEALSQDWDLRINGHLPFNNLKTVYSSTTGPASPDVELYNGGLYLITGPTSQTTVTEHAFRGIDAEIGWRLPLERWSDSNAAKFEDLRLYLGGYYFENSAFADTNIAGPRARAEWRINDIISELTDSRLTLETSWQYDDVRGHQVEAGARLRIPLGVVETNSLHFLTAQEERMTEGLPRYTGVVSRTKVTVAATSSSAELVEDAVTGVHFSTAVIAANDTADLQTVLTNAGNNALIIVQGGPSNFGSMTMLANQTVLGGGGTLTVRGVNSGTLASYTAPGSRPTIRNDVSGSPAVTTADNSHLVNLYIAPDQGAFRVGVAVGANQQVFLDHVEITTPEIGISIDGSSSSLTVRDSYLHNAADGIYINAYADSVNINVSDTEMKDIVYAFSFNGTNTNATISEITFSGDFDYYLRFMTAATTTLHNSNGNIDAASHKANYCYATDENRFTGSISFANAISISNTDCSIW